METAGLKHFNDGDEWMTAEDIPNIDFFFCQTWLRAFVNGMSGSCGMNYSKILGVFKGTDMSFYYGKKNALDFALNLVRKLDADPAYGDEINANIMRFSDELEKHANSIPGDLAGKSNAELWAILDAHLKIHSELYSWGWLSNATDMFYPEFTELLKEYLRTKAGSEEQVNALFVALTSPEEKSKEAMQHEEFLEIAIDIENDPFHKALFTHKAPPEISRGVKGEVRRKLEDYHAKYSPITALWIGEPAPLEHFTQELQTHYFLQEKSPAQEFEDSSNGLRARLAEKQRLEQDISVDEKHAHLFKVFGDFMITKLYRRYAQLRSLYRLRGVFKEISMRFGISLDEARFMLWPEYERLLVKGDFDSGGLAERKEFCVLYSEEGRDLVFTGAEAKRLAESATPKIREGIKELKGQCACLGYAKGRVKIILSPADLPKMQRGDVLVAIATNPDVVPAMKKAGAIVTEQGGVTSHAAIVSRELGVPCVIGTKIATKVLKDGDLVEVDAMKGIVRKLE